MTSQWTLCFFFFIPSIYIGSTSSAPDFSFYLQSILKNHTAHACENDILSIECPSRTSVAVLSVFYGRRAPSQHVCPSTSTNNSMDEDTQCTSVFAIEKVRSECQDQQSCHIPVLSRVFGHDPCPLTSKYLLVYYKCKPEHHRTRLVCENERLRLVCKNSTVLAIYSATFGHLLHGSPYCPQQPGSHTDMECLSSSSLRKVSRRCHGRENCSLVADVLTFGDPCFPGTRKHLRVSFTCVPRYLLEETGRGSVADPFMISDYTHGGWYTGPSHRPQYVFTNSLEVIEKMLDFPEKVALYFVSGICAGLIFLLCLFGLRSTLVKDVKQLVSELKDDLKVSHRQSKEIMDDLFDEEISDTSSFCRLTKSYRTNDIHSPSTLTLQMAKHEVQMHLPNGDVWPYQDSSLMHNTIDYNKQ